MKNKLNKFVFIVLWGINILFVFIVHKNRKLISDYHTANLTLNENLKNQKNQVYSRLAMRIESDDATIPPDFQMETYAGEIVNFINLCSSNSTLVLRISFLGCQLCNISECQRLKEVFRDTVKDRVAIIFSGARISEVIEFKKLNNLEYNCYLLEEEILDIPFDKRNKPYLFVLNAYGEISSFFIPDLNDSKLSSIYYSEIKKKMILH